MRSVLVGLTAFGFWVVLSFPAGAAGPAAGADTGNLVPGGWLEPPKPVAALPPPAAEPPLPAMPVPVRKPVRPRPPHRIAHEPQPAAAPNPTGEVRF